MSCSASLGQFWAGSMGALRMTREGQAGDFLTQGALVDIPIDERNIRRQAVGSDLAVASWRWHGGDDLTEIYRLKSDRTSVPWIRWPRLASIPNAEPIVTAVMAELASISASQTSDEVTVHDLPAAPCGRHQWWSPGILFDWEVEAPTGVTAAQDGSWINVGALAAGESFDIWLLNLHDPAPTTTDTDWLVEEATDALGTGLATVAASPGDFPAISATPLYAIVTIDGAWTPGFLRLGIETPADGLSYPMALITRRSTDEPPV